MRPQARVAPSPAEADDFIRASGGGPAGRASGGGGCCAGGPNGWCPNGPFRFGDVLGPKRIHEVLSTMYRLYADPRYRPNIWLTRRASLNVSLLTPEP